MGFLKCLRGNSRTLNFGIPISDLFIKSIISYWYTLFAPLLTKVMKRFLVLSFGVYKLAIIKLPGIWLFIQVRSFPINLIYPSLAPKEEFPKIFNTKFFEKSTLTLSGRFFGKNIVFSDGDLWKKYHRIAAKSFNRIWATEPFGHIAERFIALLRTKKTVEITSLLKR